MRILFFDMEFADGRVPGSIYSIGYVVTDGNFKIKKTATDLLINPESSWNSYVKKNILALCTNCWHCGVAHCACTRDRE